MRRGLTVICGLMSTTGLEFTGGTFAGAGGSVYLTLEGTDTFASVYLNGTLVGTCCDAFLDYRFPVDGVKAEENVLLIWFRSAKEKVNGASKTV